MPQADTKAITNSPKDWEPLVYVGTRLRALQNQYNALENSPIPISDDPHSRQVELDNLQDQIDACRIMVSTLPATTVAGCLVQANQLFVASDMHFLSSFDEDRRKPERREQARLIQSIREFLTEQMAPALAEAISDPAVHSERFNKWRPADHSRRAA